MEEENSIIEEVSHDLKGIISKINSLNKMLVSKFTTEGDDETLQLLSYITILCKQGKEVTDSLTSVFEPESQNHSHFEKISINELLTQQAKIYLILAEEKKIKLKTIIPPKTIYCIIDPFKLLRVIDNIFSNALKFTMPEGQITISLTTNNAMAILTITDTGIGIPESLQTEVFKKYTKAKRYGTHNEGFTGLGLYISKNIIKSLGGEISFKSQENQGTTFYISLSQVNE